MRKFASVILAALFMAAPAFAQEGDNPDAWARMLGTDEKYKAEQQAAASQAHAYTNAELNRNFLTAAALERSTPQWERDKLVRTLEQVYADKIGVANYRITSASYFPQGQDYVICGQHVYYLGTTEFVGSFVYNSRVNGTKAVNVTENTARVNGCFSVAGFKLTR